MLDKLKEWDAVEIIALVVVVILGVVALPLSFVESTHMAGGLMFLIAFVIALGVLIYEGGKHMGRVEAYRKAGWEWDWLTDMWVPKK